MYLRVLKRSKKNFSSRAHAWHETPSQKMCCQHQADNHCSYHRSTNIRIKRPQKISNIIKGKYTSKLFVTSNPHLSQPPVFGQLHHYLSWTMSSLLRQSFLLPQPDTLQQPTQILPTSSMEFVLVFLIYPVLGLPHEVSPSSKFQGFLTRSCPHTFRGFLTRSCPHSF